jgi:hypothetical protein
VGIAATGFRYPGEILRHQQTSKIRSSRFILQQFVTIVFAFVTSKEEQPKKGRTRSPKAAPREEEVKTVDEFCPILTLFGL